MNARYKRLYGANRIERANRMAQNIPPQNVAKPSVGTFNGATFTKGRRYVEDIRNTPERDYFVVRSQKYGTKNNWRRTYKVSVGMPIEKLPDTMNPANWSCNCKDTQRCKHIYAVLICYSADRRKYMPRLRILR